VLATTREQVPEADRLSGTYNANLTDDTKRDNVRRYTWLVAEITLLMDIMLC